MRKSWLSSSAVLLAAVLALAGCTPKAAEKPAEQFPAAAPPTAETPAATPERLPESASLFPPSDWELTFKVWDAGAAAAAHPVEQWLRDGNRLVMAADGKPYAAWVFDDAGVWRPDPKGGGTLLRYLPPVLKDGETWRQQSGDAQVWFSLTRAGSGPCPNSTGRSLDGKTCWTLSVLNRGELTTFSLAKNLGPFEVKSVNYQQPSSSFSKEVTADQAGRLGAAERKALLERAPAPSAPRAQVTPATAAEFAAARQNLPGIITARADLDGDGQEETLRGPLGTWTTADIDILDKDGNLLTASRTGAQEQRISLVRFRGATQPFALVEHRGGGDFSGVTIAKLIHPSGGWYLQGSFGWDVKSTGTPANRVAASEDGLVTVEWDMGDPARHTRVRQYRFDPATFLAKRETQSYRPEGKELVYPAEPLDVLQAAFVARWLGLSDELPRYFATKEAAAALLSEKGISEPNYAPGIVWLATITNPGPACAPRSTPAALDGNGTAPFLANWGGYEWQANAWGRVTFSKDAQGRPVIQQLQLEGTCFSG